MPNPDLCNEEEIFRLVPSFHVRRREDDALAHTFAGDGRQADPMPEAV